MDVVLPGHNPEGYRQQPGCKEGMESATARETCRGLLPRVGADEAQVPLPSTGHHYAGAGLYQLMLSSDLHNSNLFTEHLGTN